MCPCCSGMFIITIRVYMHSRVVLSTWWCVVVFSKSVKWSEGPNGFSTARAFSCASFREIGETEPCSCDTVTGQVLQGNSSNNEVKAHPEISFWFCKRHVFSSFVSHILLSGCWNWIVQVVISPTLSWFLAETSWASLYSSFNKFVPHKQDCGSYCSCYCPESFYKTYMIKHG